MAFGVYVHVPWCRIRCPYCAFYVEPDRNAPHRAWLDAIRVEWEGRASGFLAHAPAAQTLYIGGGTPSRLPAELLAELARLFPLLPDAELSLEANPEDVTLDWALAVRDAGFHRVSLGVQTLDPGHARTLSRLSGQRAAAQAISHLRQAGFPSFSLDLMFALPNQTLAELDADLSALLAFDPPHVSLYGLTYEPDTGFARARERGRMAELPDNLWRDMHDLIVTRLSEAGLDRYEVSNFAKPGHRSRHNQSYWQDQPYAGLGPSAHGYAPDGSRWQGVANLSRWLADPVHSAQHEQPTDEQAAIDLIISAMRSVEGLSLSRLASRTHHHLEEAVLLRLITQGLLIRRQEVISLSPAGFPLADAVVTRLADALIRG